MQMLSSMHSLLELLVHNNKSVLKRLHSEPNGVPAMETTSQTDTPKQAFKSLVLNGKFSCKKICEYPLLVSPKDTATTTSLSVHDTLTKMGLLPGVQDLGLTLLLPSCLPSTNSSVVIATEIHDPGDFWI